MRKTAVPFLLLLVAVAVAAPLAQAPPPLSPAVAAFVAVDAPLFALTHVRVIDGTGGPVREDRR